MAASLPIDELRAPFEAALASGPVVVSSPTGSGKSTQVPRWCPGRVLVVEPRRVACRSLAQRVAELEDTKLGEAVGYHVRDEKRRGAETRILFATPGVVLRIFDELERFDTVVLDEFHERSLDVDLLLALLHQRYRGRLVVMSATLEGERVATHLGGRHLHGAGRVHEVRIRHLARGALLPDVRGLEERLRAALKAHDEEPADGPPGDVLVFLPGKGEIASCASALGSFRERYEVLELHGGLTLAEQNRAFRESRRPKVILATNVAETSITLPGVTAVIDSGLVRRTQYHRGRGFLTLSAIALDSADQRAGRAGRVRPGVAWRLWDEAARLEKRTPPEVYRESLAPLVLGAAACGADVDALRFLDPPHVHALESAHDELRALTALDAENRLTEHGRTIFGLPLDAPLGRLLVEARIRSEAADADDAPTVLDDMIDLVAVLATGRSLLTSLPNEDNDSETASPWSRCDVTILVRALRGALSPRGDQGGKTLSPRGDQGGKTLSPRGDQGGETQSPRGDQGGKTLSPRGDQGGETQSGRDLCRSEVLREVRATRRRLRQAHGLAGPPPEAAGLDRRRLALTILAADPRAAHVARRRGRRLAWSNGGTEVALGRRSAAQRAEDAEALVVVETRALGVGARDKRTLVTCAMPVPLAWLLAAGLGRDRLAGVSLEAGRPVARIERVFARRVLAVREEEPRGELARQAIAELFIGGKLFPASAPVSRERLRLASLARRLVEDDKDVLWAGEVLALFPDTVPAFEPWVASRLEALGVESAEDVELLSEDDLLAPELPAWVRSELERAFPRELEVAGAAYEIDYDLERREALLRQVRGRPHQLPPEFALPRLPGFSIKIEHRGTKRTLR